MPRPRATPSPLARAALATHSVLWIGAAPLLLAAAGGCQPQGTGAIPPPPVSVRDPALVERPGTPPSTRPVISDPASEAPPSAATPDSDAARVNARVQAHLDAMNRAGETPAPRTPLEPTAPASAAAAAAAPSLPSAVDQPQSPAVDVAPVGSPSVAVTPASSTPPLTPPTSPATPIPDITVGPPAARSTPSVQVSPPSTPPVSVAPASADAASSSARSPQPAIASGGGGVGGGAGGAGGGVESSVADRLARDPRDVSAALDAQLLNYLREKPAPDAAALAALPTEDRELISAVLDALVNFRAGVRADPNATYAAKSRPLADLADRVRLKSDLAVPVLTFASAATGFGVYEPSPATLSPRGNTSAILYYEVANFTSRLNDKKLWETRLTQQFTLFDATGKQVWQDRLQSITDTCRNRRTDFFMGLPLRLPAVPAGKYTLKLTLTDLNVGRVAEGVLSVESK